MKELRPGIKVTIIDGWYRGERGVAVGERMPLEAWERQPTTPLITYGEQIPRDGIQSNRWFRWIRRDYLQCDEHQSCRDDVAVGQACLDADTKGAPR